MREYLSMTCVFWIMLKLRRPFFLVAVEALLTDRCTTMCSRFSTSCGIMGASVYPARLLASASLHVPSSIMVLVWDNPHEQDNDWNNTRHSKDSESSRDVRTAYVFYPAAWNYLCSESLSELALPPVLYGGKIIDCGVLKHREENKHKADPQVNVHSFDVRNTRHGRVHAGDDGGHSEHCSDTCKEDNCLVSLATEITEQKFSSSN